MYNVSNDLKYWQKRNPDLGKYFFNPILEQKSKANGYMKYHKTNTIDKELMIKNYLLPNSWKIETLLFSS